MRFTPLYSAAQTRVLDGVAIERHGIPGIVLMRRAALAALAVVRAHWPAVDVLHIVCGGGNNGGDGLLLAALAHQRGYAATVYLVVESDRLRGDAATALAFARDAGVVIRAPEAIADLDAGLLVDAVLGTGCAGELRPAAAAAVVAMNATGLPCLALDVPSGLCADTGACGADVVRANVTVTFIAHKCGLYTGAAAAVTGVIEAADLGVPASVFADVEPRAGLLDLDACRQLLPARSRVAHKGHYGHVLVVGGDYGFGGAALLAAEAALRGGAGLVSLATRAEHASAALARRPEIMVHGISCRADLAPLLRAASVLVLGPGLGRSSWSAQLLDAALAVGLPCVLDADALNLLAAGVVQMPRMAAERIITPHPGEAARLLDQTTAVVQADRYAAALALQARWGGVAVLKGAGTVIAAESSLWVSAAGNPGMASGGMGDVLAGLLGALLAQDMSAREASVLGVCLHGAAGDRAAAGGQRSLLAGDLFEPLRELLA